MHPDRVLDEAALASLPAVEAVHGLTEGLQQRYLQRAIDGALARLPSMPEWQDASALAANKLGGFAAALHRLHHPQEPADITAQSLARQRLALDELLAHQLALRPCARKCVARRDANITPAGGSRLRSKPCCPFR